jgi:hypothetical protein
MTQLVPDDIVAHRFELAPFAASHRASLYRKERPCAQRFQLHFARTPHVGIDLDGLRLAYACLTPDEAQT